MREILLALVTPVLKGDKTREELCFMRTNTTSKLERLGSGGMSSVCNDFSTLAQ